MGIFIGTVQRVDEKSNARGDYLGVVASNASLKVWFSAPTWLRDHLTSSETIRVEYQATRPGSGGITFLQCPFVLGVNGAATERPAAPSASEDFSAIYQLFQSASGGLKRPKIRLTAGDFQIRLYAAGERSRVPGAVNVVDDRPYGEGSWYGRINQDGSLTTSRKSPPEAILEALHALTADPARAAAKYGRETGNCCFCSRELTDARSITVGYGPVCAGHYCLPWGTIDG